MSSLARSEPQRRIDLAALVRAKAWEIVLWSAIAVWSMLLYATARENYAEFRYGRFDLGHMVQAVWSTAQGRPLEITMGSTGEQTLRLAGHVDPILALLAPIWLVAPSPLALMAVQIVGCALGALPVFWLGRRHLRSETAAGLLALAYLTYPWLAWATLDSVHPVTLAIPLLLYAVWFLDGDRLVAFALVAALACLAGELVGISVAMLGVWYAVARGKRSAGLAIAAAGAAWSAICVYLIVPSVSGGPSMFYSLYDHVGGSPQGVLRTALTDPGAIASALVADGDPVMFLFLVLPTAGLCLLSPGLAAVALPQLLANGLSSQHAATDPRYHYVSVLVPFLIGATVLGVARLPSRFQVLAATGALTASAGISALVGVWTGPIDNGSRYTWRPSDTHLAALNAAVSRVPDGVPVSGTNLVGGHLSARRRFYSMPLIARAEWVVIDTHDPWIPFPLPGAPRQAWGSFQPAFVDKLVNQLASSRSWRTIVAGREGIYVFQRVA